MIGFKLTEQEAELLNGKEYTDGCFFNPVPDINVDDYIFEGEVNGCTNEKYMWVKDLEQVEYVPPINNNTP